MPSHKKCVVPGCDYLTRPAIQFHCFPTKPECIRSWTDFCKLPNDVHLKGTDAICDRHFRDEDYLASFTVLNRPRKLWRLRPDAVPTLFPDASEVTIQMEGEGIEVVVEDYSETYPITYHYPDNAVVEDVVEVEESFILPEEISSVSRCRLCLTVPADNEANAVDLFATPDGQEESLHKTLLQFFQIEFEDFSDWPSIVCASCVEFITQMQEFRHMIVQANSQLHQERLEEAEIPNGEIPIEELRVEEEVEEEEEEEEEEEQEEHSVLEDPSSSIIEDHVDSSVLDDHVYSSTSALEESTSSNITTTTTTAATKRNDRPSPEQSAQIRQLLTGMNLLTCALCGQKNGSLENLNQHMRNEHLLLRGYIVCCKRKHEYRAQAIAHMEWHLDGEKFKCDTCGQCFLNGNSLRKHKLFEKRAQTGKNPFTCATCGKSYPIMSRLKKHEIGHLPVDERPFQCSYCERRFINKAQMVRHVQRLHEVEERHVCEECGRGFSNYHNYWDHRNAHRKKRMAEGRVPGEVSVRKRMKTEPVDDGVDPVACPSCQKVMGRAMMRLHSREHYDGAGYGHYCEICMVRVKGGGRFRDHMDKHNLAEYVCTHCSPHKSLDSYQAFYLHTKTKHPTVYQETIQNQKKGRPKKGGISTN